MKNPTGTKQGKLSGIPGGGSSHVRYDHKRRPARLEIKCPSCNNRAIAQDNHAEEDNFYVGDLSPNWKESSFSVMCTSCMYRG